MAYVFSNEMKHQQKVKHLLHIRLYSYSND